MDFNPRAPYGARHEPPTYTAAVETFQSSCPVRGTTLVAPEETDAAATFQSSCPVRGTTCFATPGMDGPQYFNPRAPYGARLRSTWATRLTKPYFNPRAPYGARHTAAHGVEKVIFNFNPRAPYGARQAIRGYIVRALAFQSSCPVRGTTGRAGAVLLLDLISILVPRTGHDRSAEDADMALDKFQSSCPVRGTTMMQRPPTPSIANFNPRAPYGARLPAHVVNGLVVDISILVPRTGHDASRKN